jgi:DNA-binding SARP family transcriptional activator
LAAQAAEADPPAWAFPETLELRALAGSDPALLVEAAALWRELQNPLATAKAEYAIARLSDPPDERGAARAKRKLRGLGVRDGAAGAAGLLMAVGPERPPPLTIQVLGDFRVLRDGVAVPASEWRSKKARGLLKLLVAAHGRAVPRDALIEVLWPDEDPKKTGNRLSVALSTVRSILDPGHAHPPDWYLRGSGDTVALDLGRVVVDAEGFLAEAAAGLTAVGDGTREEAVELLEAAEASYAGDFLTEDLYEDWASTPREELRSTYVQVARALASLTDEPRTSARYLRRVLERDPHDEQTHLDLVAALAAGRAQGEARRAYRAYVARMEEIGIEPAPFPV